MQRGPTSPRPAHRRADVDEIDEQVSAALELLRARLQPQDHTPEDAAICTVENFGVVALAVFRKTNPSKIRSEARTAEIGAWMAGKRECLGTVSSATAASGQR